MVSNSCVKLIELSFKDDLEIIVEEVEIGRVKLKYKPRSIKPKQIGERFKELGFPVVKDAEDRLVEEIKIAAIELVHYAYNTSSLIRNSDYLSEKLTTSYDKLSKTFSDKTGVTLERYIILLKIEKVKELLLAGEHTLSEIAYMLGYSSVHYLSNQFKKVAGVTVSEFKADPVKYRISIEELLS